MRSGLEFISVRGSDRIGLLLSHSLRDVTGEVRCQRTERSTKKHKHIGNVLHDVIHGIDVVVGV